MKTKKKVIDDIKYKKAHGCTCYRSKGQSPKGSKCKYPQGGYQREKSG